MKVVSKRDDFVVKELFYFEPVQRFEYKGDMFSFGTPVTGVFAVTEEIYLFLQ